MCDCCILAITASMICDDGLIVGRTLTTMTWSWTRRSMTSSAVRGLKRIICSTGRVGVRVRDWGLGFGLGIEAQGRGAGRGWGMGLK